MNKVQLFESKCVKQKGHKFEIGDTVVVSVKIVEEGKSRIQDFEGIVISIKNMGVRSTFTVRKISYGEGVERVFPLYSPRVESVEVKKKGKTKRAKLYFLKTKVGKKTRIEERIDKAKETPLAKEPEANTAGDAKEATGAEGTN